MAKSLTLIAAFEAAFSSLYMAAKSPPAQASAKRLAASLPGDPGAPAAAPMTKATSAITASGRVRVRSLRRRSGSDDNVLTGGKVVERSPPCFYSAMTALDWAIVAFTAAFGLWGYRQGLIVGALT